MYSETGAASKKQTTTGIRSVLSDKTMLENSCEISSKPGNDASSKYDSSDCEDEPVVKRPRKTIRRVADTSQILSSNYYSANVYTTVAKKSFEEIKSSKLDFPKYCLKQTENIQKVEQNSEQNAVRISLSDSDDDLIEIGCSRQDSKPVSCVRSPSPEPPSPPPLVKSRPIRNSHTMLKNLNKIQSSLKKITKALDSETCVDQCLDDSLPGDSLDLSHDNVNKNIIVMVKIGSQIKRFPMNKNDLFCNLFSFLAEEKEVPDTRLMLLLNDRTIHQNETPASIQLEVSDILDCFITEEENEGFSERTGPNVIRLFIQSNINPKSKIIMRIGKFEMLQGILDMYAKQYKLPVANSKLRFDGEIVDTSQTPADLDMEDEDCLDLIMPEAS